jgi:asparagine synthase (glutamine-hydrolysing)
MPRRRQIAASKETEMCGIAGIVGNLPDIEDRLRSMSAGIAHRGPDDEGCNIWQRREGKLRTGLAHRRLSIIDLSAAGRQPMSTADGRCSIICNGEIYNYLELRHGLLQQGIQLKTNSDTEVLLNLYQQHGNECLDLLRGMFAFAIRNNDSGELFIARDRLGIKPLYYYSRSGSFIFCSELRGLLASGLVPRVLDPVSLDSYLSFGAVQEPRTIIRDVRSLPPAHFLVIDGDGKISEPQCYWRLPAVNGSVSREDAVAGTRALLEESAKLHLVADVPLGAFLSSGIDSSAIVASISKYKDDVGRLKTFTVCFNEHEFSEHLIARRTAERLGTDHTEIFLTEAEMLESMPKAISAIDQPTIDGVNTWVIANAARQAGVTVALSGLGGDELFGGYPSFRRAMKLQRYGSPMTRLNPAAREFLAQITRGLFGDSLQSQKMASVISSGADPLASYASMRGLFSRATRQSLVNARVNGEKLPSSEYKLPDETLELIRKVNGGLHSDAFNRTSAYEMGLYMSNMLLRDTDAMSMASALEVRVPLLDHKLVEWVYSLPKEIKTGRVAKQLLVDAVGADLPSEIYGRKKMGFALPFARWIRTTLKAFVSDALNDEAALRNAGLSPAGVLDVLKRFQNGSCSTSWSRVWGLTVLVDWCRRHQAIIADSTTEVDHPI